MTRTDSNLAISPQERAYLTQQDLEKFWYSRLQKKDPVARIGYALWVKDVNNLKLAISTGDPAYWNHKGFKYWDAMARSTVVNLAVGLERGGFHGNFSQTRAKIREVGLSVAKWHARFVQQDYDNTIGAVPGLLSLKQMADYHHRAFQEFNIPPSFYGGTWFGAVPEQIQFETYGNLYCHDCDSNAGYNGGVK